MTDRAAALLLLRRLLDDPEADFREGQWEAIDALVNKRARLLLVQRTGWGKSAIYFIATRLLRNSGFGTTLIVSPLLALMRNQIEAAERMGIRARTINSTNKDEWSALQAEILSRSVDVLLVSPERLANEQFMQDLLLPIAAEIGLLVVDEAHCISDWGHDFRPDYRRLANILRQMPRNIPIVGTTATASERVINDVKQQLEKFNVQRGELMRESLHLQTIRLPSQAERLAWLADYIDELPGTGITYVLTKRDAEQVSDWLTQCGIQAKPYYSGIENDNFPSSSEYRTSLEKMLDRNELKTLVATTALGMGYDKPDLGFVVHFQAPSSIISYYQQVGRAGRSIDRAYGILLSGIEDDYIHEYFRRTAFPEEQWVVDVLRHLERGDGMTIRELEQTLNLRYGQIEKVTKMLAVENPAPIIKQGSKYQRTAIPYRLDSKRIERLSRQREEEWQEVQSYIDEPTCLMRFLARVLDDPNPQNCGKCSSCRGDAIVDTSISRETVIDAQRFLRQADLPLICNKQIPRDSLPIYGWSGNLSENLRSEPGRILSRWGDAAWGEVVQKKSSQVALTIS